MNPSSDRRQIRSCASRRSLPRSRWRTQRERAEAVSVSGCERRVGVHGPAARRRAGVSRSSRSQRRFERPEVRLLRARPEQRRRADRAEHVLRARADRVSAATDRERVGRYAARRPPGAAAAQRDGARRRRQGRRARRAAFRVGLRVPTRCARRRASARPAVPAAVCAVERRARVAGVSRRDDAHRSRAASTPSTS